MSERPQVDHADQPKGEDRKEWIKPAVQKIAAGEAEIGTRARSDGSFTTS